MNSPQKDNDAMMHVSRIHQELRNINRKVSPQLLGQIREGVTPSQYLIEGLWIMQDAHLMLENVKNGNYNNFVASLD